MTLAAALPSETIETLAIHPAVPAPRKGTLLIVIPDPVAQYFCDNVLVGIQPVGGGCINNGARLRTPSGATFFLKTNRQAPVDMFAREAKGLQALFVGKGPRLPRPLLWGADLLLLEDLAPAGRPKPPRRQPSC